MTIYYGNELYHYGVKGQKWGERKYQYEDGSLTPEGREHYGYGKGRSSGVTGLSKNIRNYAGRRIQDAKQGYIDIKENGSTGLKRQVLNAYGLYTGNSHGRNASAANVAADAAENRLRRSQNRGAEASSMYNKRDAYNARERAKHERSIADSSSVADRLSKKYFEVWSVPQKSLTGKESTIGKEVVKTMLTGGGYGVAELLTTEWAVAGDFWRNKLSEK